MKTRFHHISPLNLQNCRNYGEFTLPSLFAAIPGEKSAGHPAAEAFTWEALDKIRKDRPNARPKIEIVLLSRYMLLHVAKKYHDDHQKLSKSLGLAIYHGF